MTGLEAPAPGSPGAWEPERKESDLTADGSGYTPQQDARLRKIHDRLIEARRELDALIGDAYLRPRASIVPVHFLDLASAAEKLRWAEKEWRELDRELREAESPAQARATSTPNEDLSGDDGDEAHAEILESSGARSS